MIIEENRNPPLKPFFSVQTRSIRVDWQIWLDRYLRGKNRPLDREKQSCRTAWTGFDRKRLNLCQKWCNLPFGWFFERVWQAKQAANRKKRWQTAWINPWTGFERSDRPFKTGIDRKKQGQDRPCFERERCPVRSRSANFLLRNISSTGYRDWGTR